MSEKQGHSYLDLAVTPDLRDCLLTPNPVVVFSKNLEEIIWCNATGAHLFGGKGIADLLSIKVPSENPLIKQLRNAVDQMRNDKSIVRGFRIHQGMRSQLLQFSIDSIVIPTGENALKIVHLPGDDDFQPSETETADFTVEAFDGFADASAVLDDHGMPLAHSKYFSELSPDEAVLEEMVSELIAEEDRLIKRPTVSAEGREVVLGMARVTENPGRNLIVIAQTAVVTAEPVSFLQSDLADKTDKNVDLPSQQQDDDYEDDHPTVVEEEDYSLVEAEYKSEALEQEDPSLDHEFLSSAEHFDNLPNGSEVAEENLTSPIQSAELNLPLGTRFAWSVDGEGCFSSLSDEMALLFGESKEDLLGRRWDEVTQSRGIDLNKEISKLLDSRNTWSGKVLAWPSLEKNNQAVELAALPSFDNTRNFAGFRGFGEIIESSDLSTAISGTEHTEFQTEAEAEAEEKEKENEDTTEEPDLLVSAPIDDEEVENYLQADDASKDNASLTNIVPFTRGSNSKSQLTEAEQKALETVREHLQETSEKESSSNSLDEPAPEEEVFIATPSDPPFTVPEVSEEPTVPMVTRNLVARSTDTGILDKLPVSIVIYSDDEILFVNQKFTEASGFASAEEITKAGGLPAIIDGPPDSDIGATLLKHTDGTTSHINPVLHSVPWQGQNAMLMSFNPPEFLDLGEADVLELTKTSEIQSILDTTNDGIVLLEADGTVLSINAPAEALFGIDFNEAVDKPFQQLFAPESYSIIRDYVANVSEDGIEHLINDGEEAIAMESNGGIIPVFVTIAKMQSTGKLCAVLRDITTWKKAEEELIQSRKHAERSSEQKSEFLAKVSHEIRTPLNAIIGFSDVMIEERFGPVENERYREYLRDIKRSGTHVLDIVNELLDLSRIEAGKLELTFEAVDLNEVVAETVALLQPQANTNRTIIRTSLSRSVPKVVADPRSIRQIILNLVSNAIKYSQTNSQVIVSTVYENNGEVALRVRDTGKGMTAEQIEKAMQPFRQAHDRHDETNDGSGLGLPLTKALVEANRAFFELESEPGNGTIAHVQFPVQRVLSE